MHIIEEKFILIFPGTVISISLYLKEEIEDVVR